MTTSTLPIIDLTPAQTNIFSRFLDTNGDGTGTTNANGDYSGTGNEDQFYIAPASGESFWIERMIVSVEDTSGFTAQEYGNLGAALTDGIEVQVRTGADTVKIDLTDGVPIETNAHWGRMCYDVDVKSWGAGNELLVCRWTFTRTGGALILNGGNSERLTVVLSDSFTGLISHYFLVQGYVRAMQSNRTQIPTSPR